MPSILASRTVSLSDDAIDISLVGFEPGCLVEIAAGRVDFMNNRWRSWGRFRADRNGSLDLSTAVPLEGSYNVASAMGLFWSMELIEVRAPDDPVRDITDSINVLISATSPDSGENASIRIERRFTDSAITDQWIRDQGFMGRLFLPPGSGPHPTVIVLSGSSGGYNLPVAALLASHGYAALALAYFGADDLPPTLNHIPLEYFEAAINWLASQRNIAEDSIGVLGTSRGGELALLLGATYQQIQAVVAYVPSAVVHSGLKKQEGSDSFGPSWTLAGKPLPWLQEENAALRNWSHDWGEPPYDLLPAFERALTDQEAVERAFIPVERINGPVMLVSGTDDRMWPSSRFSRMVVDRLEQSEFKHAVRHLEYEGAGHMIFPPFAPTSRRNNLHRIMGADFNYGGTTYDDAVACIDSWPKVLAFLEAALRDE